jgi:hypothetical protein
MNKVRLSLFFCFLCFFSTHAQINYSFAIANNDNPDSNTDLPSNAPLGMAQKSVIFSSAGFEDQEAVLGTTGSSQETSLNGTSSSATSLMRRRLPPLVIGSSFMTPSAWGAASVFAFASISGTPYQT